MTNERKAPLTADEIREWLNSWLNDHADDVRESKADFRDIWMPMQRKGRACILGCGDCSLVLATSSGMRISFGGERASGSWSIGVEK